MSFHESTFLVSFRLKEGVLYNLKYKHLTEYIKSAYPQAWSETSSFYVLRANETASTLLSDLKIMGLLGEEDILLVVDVSRKNYAESGAEWKGRLWQELGQMRI